MDLTKLTHQLVEIISNEEAIKINQQWSGHSGTLLRNISSDVQVWYKPQPNSTVAVLVINAQNNSINATVALAELNMTGSCAVRDVWRHQDLGQATTAVSTEVGPTDSQFLLLAPLNRVLKSDDDELVVSTSSGAVRGCFTEYVSPTQNETLRMWSGIPFAAPPKRWTPPQPAAPWEGVRNATAVGSKCVQADGTGSENCLFLNIAAHKNQVEGGAAVFVWIHGGGYVNGSGDIDAGGLVALFGGQLIVVAIQYRLGLQGFLGAEQLRPRDESRGSTGN